MASAICRWSSREANDFGLLDGAASGLIGCRHHKVLESAFLNFRGALQALQNLVWQPRFQACGGPDLVLHS